jgi:UTP--glucose-1-phosphate uridylyltransferase
MANLRGLKAVITAGGIGTRLLPFSKEIPKEMSPILTKNSKNNILVKPIIQAIFEQLYDFGIRDFFIIVGRGKRAIEDHFTPDFGFLELLKSRSKSATNFPQSLNIYPLF